MAIIVTSREFNQRASQILKISETQPVFITKWGKIVSVLSNYSSYQQQTQKEQELEQVRKKTTFRVCEFEDIE